MYGELRRMRLPVPVAAPRPLAWVAAFLAGSLFGLGLRLTCFLAGALVVRGLGELIAWLAPLVPSLDPVYTHVAGRSLVDLQLPGAALVRPLGDWLHSPLPSLLLPATRAHSAFLRV